MKKVFSFVLVVALFVGAFAAVNCPQEPVLNAAIASSVEDAKDKIKESQERQKELQAQLKDLAAQKETYMDQKQIIEQQVGELEDEIAAYDLIIASYDAQIASLEAEIVEAQATYDDKLEKFKIQVRAAYEKGETSYLDILFGAGSFSDFLLRLDYVKQVALYEKELLESINRSVDVIEKNIASVEVVRAEQVAARSVVEGRKAEVDAKNAEITRLIESVLSDEEAVKKQHESEARQEEALNDYIEKELEKENSDVSYQQGEWIWPVGKAKYNYVSSPFGWRTLYGKKEFHYAIDIAAPGGTPVYASKSGVVKSAGWVTTGGGWKVVLDHGDTYYTHYNHMKSRPLVKAGQYVEQGTIIGYVGSTGNSTGNHLDFKIYYNGKAQDPLNYVKNPY